jgi:chorismate-pyruvate lyase
MVGESPRAGRGEKPADNLIGATSCLSQHERPARFAHVDVSELRPELRLLLFHDGTLTAALEAQQLAPVVVDVHEQEEMRLDEMQARWLGTPTGSTAVRRRATIRNQRTSQPLVQAQSLLLLERLPNAFPATLACCAKGLGEALVRLNVVYRRELLWYGQTVPTDGPVADCRLAGRSAVARCYRLICDGRPVSCIEERFPTSLLSEGGFVPATAHPHRKVAHG